MARIARMVSFEGSMTHYMKDCGTLCPDLMHGPRGSVFMGYPDGSGFRRYKLKSCRKMDFKGEHQDGNWRYRQTDRIWKYQGTGAVQICDFGRWKRSYG
uniref:Uncharacterized protein n=1 Tax=Candidatus Nitrotoga fabula TaxID=2182327 RepID=A0A2X0QYB9_9PROT|nr:protein of unknown function [Candidatus Nitrotoga fabula]